MKKLLLIILLIMGHISFAQTYGIQGRVAEKEIGGLPSASVSLLQASDSLMVASTSTDTAGVFTLSNIDKGEYIFKVTSVGFAPYFRNITTPSGTDTLHLGTIELKPTTIELQPVIVTSVAPVVVKTDTVEYNADSFGTRPNANVEQLLKKLPGVDVESDGNIRVQGQSVTRIFVDGKEFFGGDLQMATKNLPADAIDKVQVIDGKSEEAQFSGIDDGQRDKVINLTLKEDRRNMGFGNATAGLGTSNRYLGQGNYNRFDKGNQLSVMGMSNNVNNQGLFGDEFGEAVRSGLTTKHTGGANIFNQINDKTIISGSYKLNHTGTDIQSSLSRQNFMPEGTASYYENSRQQNRNSGHQANARIEHKGIFNTIKFNTTFNYSGAQSNSSSSRQSYSVVDTIVNEGERNSLTRNNNLSLNANLFYGHRFRKEGRLFTITNQFSAQEVDTKGRSESMTRFSEGTEEDVRQRNEQDNTNLNFNIRLSYTEPLGNKQYLQANYNLSNRSSRSDLKVFDIFNETSELNTEQSSRFSTGFLYQQAGLTYRLNRNKYNLTIGSNVQQSTLTRTLQLTDDQVKRSFQNILPSLLFNIKLHKFTQLNIGYSTSVREPAINQLQPVVFRYDPLNLYVGNPNLRPEYTHQGKLDFNSVSSNSGVFIAGSIQFNYTTNPITAAVTIDERQIRTIQYINVEQNQLLAAFLNIGLPVKKYNSRFNLSPYLNLGQSVNLLNGVAGTIVQRSVGGNLGYTYRYKDYVEINARTHITVSDAAYELNKNQNQVFVTSAYMADATVHFLKHYAITGELNYNRFRNTRTNFNQAIPIINFSLSRYLLKENRGELKMSAFNILNRNVGATQLATLNYIEQSTQNALGNYYMVTFTYSLND